MALVAPDPTFAQRTGSFLAALVFACGVLFMIAMPATAFAQADTAVPRGTPIHVGSSKRLTWDESLFDTVDGVRFEMQRPHRTGERNIVADRPWESWQLGAASKLLREGDRFRMWYMVSHGVRHGEEYAVAYAESTDGIRWTKPELGLVDYAGSKKNNLVVGYSGAFGDVFVDPNAPPESRYRMAYAKFPSKAGDPTRFLALLSSPDGLRWTEPTDKIIPTDAAALDTQSQVFWDRRLGKYLLYSRLGPWRQVGRSESADPRSFPSPVNVMKPDDPVVEDYYQAGVTPYDEAPGAYVAMVPCFFHPGDAAGKPVGRDKLIEVTYGGNKIPVVAPDTVELHLFTSNDSTHWKRRGDHTPFVGLGPDGAFDCRSIYTGLGYAVVGDEIWMYYSGYPVTHVGCLQDPRPFEQYYGVISRMTLRLDGFVAATAGRAGGTLVTKPLVFDGTRLELNIDCGAGGWADVELQDADGKPLPGFTLDDSDRVYHNNIRKAVTWNGLGDVSRLKGRPVRLKIVTRSARLYAFQFGR